jgi:chemotaxis protein CheX
VVERYQFSEIVDAFVDAAKEVVTQILGVEVVGQQDGAGDALITFDGVVAVVGFSGAFSGRLLLGIPEPLSVALFHALGGETLPSPDEELFAASEFGNLVTGHALTSINNRFPGSNARPSPPSAFLGKRMVFFNFGTTGSRVILATPYGDMKMDIAFKEEP